MHRQASTHQTLRRATPRCAALCCAAKFSKRGPTIGTAWRSAAQRGAARRSAAQRGTACSVAPAMTTLQFIFFLKRGAAFGGAVTFRLHSWAVWG